MSTRPARRTAGSRRKIVQSDSDGSEVEETQNTPTRADRRTTVGSRASFDDDYTPRTTRGSILKTPSTVRSRALPTPGTRAPLTEARKGQTQSQLPFTATKLEAKRTKTTTTRGTSNKHKKSTEDAFIVNDAQKENQSPIVARKLNLNTELPRPPTLPLHTLIRSSTITVPEVAPIEENTNINNVLPETKGPKTRIVISKLVLENFKSYAGIQCIGPFHKSFSAVVGPNGSGKSNVIDSLLFVFGFRASKMRQGKISALIHNSAAHPDLGHCSVEVHFETTYESDDPEDYRVVEDSVIVVARKAYKNNSSKYTINDRESSFTEVTTLLKDRGIDLDHKRFLILQGEVESIAQMRPKAANEHDDGLLEYLEDIIGTSKYKAPIEGALDRMEALNGICQEKHSRVQIVETERSRLEERKDVALQQILAENELASKQSALFQLLVSEARANLVLTSDVIGDLESEILRETKTNAGNEQLMETLKIKQSEALKEQEQLKALLAKFTAQAAKAEKDNVSLQEKMKHLSIKQKKLSKASATAQHALTESTAQIETSAEEIIKFRSELVRLEQSLTSEDQELTRIRLSLKDKTQVFTDQIESKQRQKQPWDAQITEQQSAMNIARSEQDMLKEKSAQVERDLEASSTQLEALQEEGATRIDLMRQVEDSINETATAITRIEKELAQLRSMEAAAKAEHAGARDKAEEARSNLSATKQKGEVLVGLTSLKESGRITGFHGRLGDLGTIDDKYDVAITTACPALNNMVVDDVEVGQQCIDHLRRHNLGRANFLLLDKLPKRDTGRISTPENVPRLADLVTAKQDVFVAAFQKVLGNTLVATDLAQANRIAYGKTRWRVVTLDGQLIESSGAMSGGGSRVSRGGMSSKFAGTESQESVAKLEVIEQKKRVDLDKLRAKILELDTKLEQLTTSAPELKTQKNLLAIEFSALEKQGKDMKKRVKELTMQRDNTNIDTKRVAELQRSMSTHEQAISKLKEETESIETDIKQLQDKILDIGGIKLRTQKSKVDGLKDQIEALQQRVDASEFTKAKAEKDIKKHAKTQENAQAELEALDVELAALQSRLNPDSTSQAVSKDAEEAKYALDECSSKIQELRQTLDAEMESVNAFRAKELELRNKLDDHKKWHAEDQKRINHWVEKLAKLCLQELSEHFLREDTPRYSLTELSLDELQALDRNELKKQIAELEDATGNAKIETGVLEEYLKRCEEYAERSKALEEAVAERDLARNTAEDLRRRRLTEFMTGFNTISLRLKEMYQMITMGGNAELELVDSLDPFSEGILFSVMPPKKSWKNISNLSGGEKTLSSLALVFALHHYKPTPLYVMDEIDAALDFRNVSIVANYIKDRTKNAQFIVISLRNNMFELSARLIGIYKTSNMTKSIAIENTEMPRATKQVSAKSQG